ncbi:MAG: VOC family protein [Candidatus Eisenbacteria bacterium]|nr:VOC family protein [Candidatus Eisenbacteria bacterium]
MPRVIHFEIFADRPERVIKFYKEVFGWKIAKWKGPVEYWLVTTGEKSKPGIDGGIMKRSKKSEATINTVDVPSVDKFIARIKKKGGEVVSPKMAIPDVGYMAYCKDTEGNVFGIMHDDPRAK